MTTEEGTTDPGDGGGGSQLAAIIGGCGKLTLYLYFHSPVHSCSVLQLVVDC